MTSEACVGVGQDPPEGSHQEGLCVLETHLKCHEPLLPFGQGRDKGGVGNCIPPQSHAVHAAEDLHCTLPLTACDQPT